ncbi:MAG: choloylglycine hydrolase family protein [Bacteroidales bacterium]
MKGRYLALCFIAFFMLIAQNGLPCTGIFLKSEKSEYILARTMEWGTFNLDSKLAIIPRGISMVGETPEGKTGLKWTSRYGAVGISLADAPILGEGINEAGLSMGVFYFPGYASYKPFDKNDASKGISILQLGTYLLTQFSTVDEVKNELSKIVIIPMVWESINSVPPVHWRIADKSGKVIVLEIVNNGQIKVYDSEIGVITNSPTYDWHLTNLRNYVNLHSAPATDKEVMGILKLSPFGVGSGFLGIPGDFTPPSRFVRATAYCATVPPLLDAYKAMSQAFVILDNFNIPIGSVYPPQKAPDLPSSTQWTSVSDITNGNFYYTTYYNRQIRKLDLKAIDFGKVKLQVIPLDKTERQNIEEIIVQAN